MWTKICEHKNYLEAKCSYFILVMNNSTIFIDRLMKRLINQLTKRFIN